MKSLKSLMQFPWRKKSVLLIGTLLFIFLVLKILNYNTMADQNSLPNYLDSVNLPNNVYSNQLGYGQESKQFKADSAMALYNNQVHQAELLQQRKWALEDAQFNTPAELRKRLEDAGYNPSLMSGMIQTANQQTRGVTANTPQAQSSNMSGYAQADAQNMANVINAGQSLMSTQAQLQAIEQSKAMVGLTNSQAVNQLAQAAKTAQDKVQAKDLFSYQVNALESQIANTQADTQVKQQYYSEMVPAQIARLAKQNEVSDAEIRNYAVQQGLNRTLTNAEVQQIKQGIQESAQRINESRSTVKLLEVSETKGWQDVAANKIRNEVQAVGKYAGYVSPYLDLVSGFIGNAIGIKNMGSMSKMAGASVLSSQAQYENASTNRLNYLNNVERGRPSKVGY